MSGLLSMDCCLNGALLHMRHLPARPGTGFTQFRILLLGPLCVGSEVKLFIWDFGMMIISKVTAQIYAIFSLIVVRLWVLMWYWPSHLTEQTHGLKIIGLTSHLCHLFIFHFHICYRNATIYLSGCRFKLANVHNLCHRAQDMLGVPETVGAHQSVFTCVPSQQWAPVMTARDIEYPSQWGQVVDVMFLRNDLEILISFCVYIEGLVSPPPFFQSLFKNT